MKNKCIIVVLAAALMLTGCGSSSTTSGTSTAQGSNTIEETTEETSEEVVEETVELADMMDIEEYSCIVDESFMYYVMYVTNNSDVTVSVEMNVTALNESGEMVGASSDSTYAIAPGQTGGIWTTFDDWDVIKSFEYTLEVSEETSYSSVYDDLSIEYNTTDSGIVAQITNNGEESAKFVWMDVVYLKDGSMVNFSELSFMDDNQELLSGVTLSAEGTCYYEDGFDEVVIAVNGRR